MEKLPERQRQRDTLMDEADNLYQRGHHDLALKRISTAERAGEQPTRVANARRVIRAAMGK